MLTTEGTPATHPRRPTLEANELHRPIDRRTFDGELRILTRGSSVGFVGQGLGAVLAFGFSVAVGRLFHARGAGTFFEAVALFTIASNIGDLGADDGLGWTLPRMRAEGRTADVRRILPIALLPVAIVSGMIAALLFTLAGPFADVFSHGHAAAHLASFIRILAPFVPLAALIQVIIAGTRGFDRVWPLVAIWSILIPAGRLLLLPVMLASGLGLLGVAYAWVAPVVLGGLTSWWVIRLLVRRDESRWGTRQKAKGRGALARNFWIFSAPRALASICAMALVWLDVLLVGWLVSVRMAGIYAVANRYLVVVTFALAAVGGTIGPQVSRLLAADRLVELRRLYQASACWVMASAWPCALGMAVFSPLLMRLFGREFAAGDTALAILSVMMLYVSATGSNVVVLVMSGSSATSLGIGVIALVLNVGANLVLIPRFGIDGAALAWAGSLFVSNVLINLHLYRRLRLHPFGKGSQVVAVASLLCIGGVGVASRALFGPHLLALVATIVVGGPIYLALLWRFRSHLELNTLLRRRSA